MTIATEKAVIKGDKAMRRAFNRLHATDAETNLDAAREQFNHLFHTARKGTPRRALLEEGFKAILNASAIARRLRYSA